MIASLSLKQLPERITALPQKAQQQLLAALIWLVLALFCGAALGHYHGQQVAAATARDRAEAEAAAKFLAAQSLEPIVAGDRISIQLLGQQVLALPAITGVSIRDVESNALAQVGDTHSGESVTAPVVLHDSIAGSVTVNLLPGGDIPFPWASLLLCLVFALPISAAAALAASSLIRRRKLSLVQAVPAPRPAREIAVGLYLRPLNWAQLSNQLSRSALEKLERVLDGQLQLLGRIYDAEPLKHAGPQQGLGFCGGDAAFRAVCCGLLLRELQGATRAAGLQLGLAVVPAQLSEFGFASELLLAQTRGLSLHPELLGNPSLDGRIVRHDASWGAEITGLTPNYQKLLDNQLRQLVHNHATSES